MVCSEKKNHSNYKTILTQIMFPDAGNDLGITFDSKWSNVN